MRITLLLVLLFTSVGLFGNFNNILSDTISVPFILNDTSLLKKDNLSKHIAERFKIYEELENIVDKVLTLKLIINPSNKLERIDVFDEIGNGIDKSLINIIKTYPNWEYDSINKDNNEILLFTRVSLFPYNTSAFGYIYTYYTSNKKFKEDYPELDLTPISVIKIDNTANVFFDNIHYGNFELVLGKNLAQHTLDYFCNKFNENDNREYYIQTIIKDNQNAELIWISNLSLKDDKFTGTLETKPNYVTNIKEADAIDVDKSDIIDWLIKKDKNMKGGFTNYVLKNNTIQNATGKLGRLLDNKSILEISKKSDIESIEEIDTILDTKAFYPGGNELVESFIYDNLTKEEKTGFVASEEVSIYVPGTPQTYYLPISGYIYISFFVEPDGAILNPKILIGRTEKTNKEILRLFNYLPKWYPATKNGEFVRSYVVLKIGLD